MTVQRPPVEPITRDDITTPRWSVRSEGDRGFLFFNNHVRQHEPPAHEATRFTVTLPSGPLSFPTRPVDIPSGAHFIWPINLDLDGATLVWATVQPLTRIEDADGPVHVFAAVDGIAPELAFAPGGTVLAGRREVAAGEDGRIVVRPEPGLDAALTVTGADGRETRIVVLSADDARQLYRLQLGGRDRLVLSRDPAFVEDGVLRVRSRDDVDFRVGVFPPLDAAPSASLELRAARDGGVFQTWTARARPRRRHCPMSTPCGRRCARRSPASP